MKKYLLSCIAFSVLLFTGCADENMPTTSTESTEPGITVSMDLAANLQVPNSPEGTRAPRFAIGYKGNENADPTKSHGYPIPIGIFNERSNSATEIADGTEVPVYCIFMSTDKDQPVTKVVTKWTYKKGGNLRLAPTSTFEMAAGTDLTKGTWYVCGILGGEQLSNEVKFNGYSEGHTTISRTGEEVTWGADIPYLFSWRKLEANAAKKSFKADKAVLFKQFGTIVRLRVENNTGFDFQYNGVRIITSNILRGQFDLKVFDKKYHDFLASNLKDTQDSDVASASSESFKKAFQMFKFYQRPLDDAAMKTGEIKVFGDFNQNYEQEIDASKKKENTALTYYDHIFLNRAWDKVLNGQKAPSYIYVWMAPQTQAVKTYPNTAEGSGTPTVEHIQKTQFLLFAKPLENATSTRANNEPVPTSINMIPAYGTLKSYLSGANYVANGKVVFEYAPLSYIAKHDNIGGESEVLDTLNQETTKSKRYAFTELTGSVTAGYFLAKNVNWRTIFAQAHAFAGLRRGYDYDMTKPLYFNHSVGCVSYAQMPTASSQMLRVFHSYSSGKNLPEAQQGHIAYMIGMAKKPSYITNDDEGQVYYGRTKQPAVDMPSGMARNASTSADWISDNKYQYVMRWEDKDYGDATKGRAVLSQRYLGPRFVLDMDDIAREEFWKLNGNNQNEYPADIKRTFPLGGYYGVGLTHTSTGQRFNGPINFWFLDNNSKGVSTQYWTKDQTLSDGRYVIPESGRGKLGYTSNDNGAPYQVVTFRTLQNTPGMSGFYFYLYNGVPTNQNLYDTGNPLYQKDLIQKAPVRLWRRTPLKD